MEELTLERAKQIIEEQQKNIDRLVEEISNLKEEQSKEIIEKNLKVLELSKELYEKVPKKIKTLIEDRRIIRKKYHELCMEVDKLEETVTKMVSGEPFADIYDVAKCFSDIDRYMIGERGHDEVHS